MVYKLLFSFSGIIFGYILGMMAVEELHDGKRYFLHSKKILFITILIISTFYFFQQNNYYGLTLFLLVGIVLFIIQLKRKDLWLEILPFILFGTVYFFIEVKLLMAILIFLYGFPIGLLIKHNHYKNVKKRS